MERLLPEEAKAGSAQGVSWGPDLARRHRRDRLLVLVLVLLILAPFLLYAWVAVGAAREVARSDALERNLATAQLGARLIDEQCTAALSVLSSLAQRRSLVHALQALPTNARPGNARGVHVGARRDHRAAVVRQLAEAVGLVPDLALVAAYRPDGVLVASYPGSPAPSRAAVGQDWFQGVAEARIPYVSNVYRLGAGQEAGPGVRPARAGTLVVGLAVPVEQPASGARGHHGGPIAYLMAPYRLRVVHEWLQPLRVGAAGILYVTDADGRVVATSSSSDRAPGFTGGEGEEHPVRLADYLPTRLALEERQGRLEAPSPDGRGVALVGYAPARVPGWAVIAVQPVQAALASSNQLLRPLSLLVLPIAALMIGAGWSIEWLYGRQMRLARQNAALSRDLVIQNERLRAADRAKSEFLANVSHDLRTPLASIKASVSGLLEPDIAWDAESLRGFLTLVNEETDRLTARVRNLLDMARIEAGALPMQKELCDLTDIVGSALERVEPLTRGRPIEAAFPPEALLVETDYAQVELVIINLLENAVKYSPPGTPLYLSGALGARRSALGSDQDAGPSPGGSACIPQGRAPSAERQAPFVIFTLRDEGPGVSPEDVERVFEKFYRAATRSSAGGTGLGLAICKAIVEAHGGAIGVRSAPCSHDKPPRAPGAEFWFTLPAAAACSPSGARST
jgi:signal transduction histidine kinase